MSIGQMDSDYFLTICGTMDFGPLRSRQGLVGRNFPHLAGKLRIGQPPTDDLTNG